LAATLLGGKCARLVGKRFDSFVGNGDLSGFNTLLRQVFATETQQRCEVSLAVGGQTHRVQIEATRSINGLEYPAMVVDISGRRRTQRSLQYMQDLLNHT
jgi:hypothetical protein